MRQVLRTDAADGVGVGRSLSAGAERLLVEAQRATLWPLRVVAPDWVQVEAQRNAGVNCEGHCQSARCVGWSAERAGWVEGAVQVCRY